MGKEIESVYAAIGLRIRRIREALGIDQATLAKRCGMTRTSLANIEAGRQRIQCHQVEKWADVLGTTPKQLMRGIWL